MKKYEFKPYNSNFPKFFDEEKNRLAQFLSGNYQIEHIGSTAIPGLGGKGIIDIMIAVSKEQMEYFSQQSQKAGYLFRPLASNKDRLFLRTEYPKDFENEKVYHLHITYLECSEWKKALSLRNYLRSHPNDLRKYAEAKKKAAKEANEDKDKYMKTKEDVLKEILRKAIKS
jgi:GrpB-like predicted nucleotidyltransferase (UPF0157 family)